MNNKKRDNVIIAALIFFIALLLGYNLYQVQVVGAAIRAREEYHQSLEAQQLEKIAMREVVKDYSKSLETQEQKTSSEIVEFDEKYISIRDSFLDKIEGLSAEFNSSIVNIEGVRLLAAERIKASEKFKQEILSINAAAEPLEVFYEIMSGFLEKDIENWNHILSYYSGDELPEEFQLEYENNSDLYHKAEEERASVYLDHGLENLLD